MYLQAALKKRAAEARTGVEDRSEFVVTKRSGETPTEWRVIEGPNKGAEVNIDNPVLAPTPQGPQAPHVGYQQAGKKSAGRHSGHILVDEVPVFRGSIADEKAKRDEADR